MGIPSFRKNTTPQFITSYEFSFETEYPSVFDLSLTNANRELSEDETDYCGETSVERYYDYGFIKLPPNYKADGDPVPLVIYIHSTGGWQPRGA